MSGRAEFLAALAAAGAVHVALLGAIDLTGGSDGGGAGGEAALNVQAMSPGVAALVEAWEAVPETAAAPEVIEAPVSDDLAAMPATEARPESAEAPRAPEAAVAESAPAEADALPRMAAVAVPELPVFAAPELPDVSSPVAPVAEPAPERAVAALAEPVPEAAPAAPERVLAAIARPRPRPSPGGEAVARRVAEGQGAVGLTRGQSRAMAAAVRATPGASASATAAWAAAIQSRIARHQSWPRGTRSGGRVRLDMVILASGHLAEVSVARSSGVAALDAAALAAAKRAAPFPPAPEGLGEDWFKVGQWVTFER